MLSIDNVLLTPGNLCRAAILAISRKIILFSCFLVCLFFICLLPTSKGELSELEERLKPQTLRQLSDHMVTT